jgi:hypothetical protein
LTIFGRVNGGARIKFIKNSLLIRCGAGEQNGNEKISS